RVVFLRYSFRPYVWNTVIAPDTFRPNGRLLNNKEVFAVPARSVSHSHSVFVPRDQIHDVKIGPSNQMGNSRTEHIFIDPEHQVPAGEQYSRHLTEVCLNVAVRVWLQKNSPFLSSALIAISLLVEHASILRVKEQQRNTL
ncbi:MAG: hypothetical protein Q8N05_22280, partial [Bacteroidota bacterium]|nr:hypothetical protein [Bacteroidota bacterium]